MLVYLIQTQTEYGTTYLGKVRSGILGKLGCLFLLREQDLYAHSNIVTIFTAN